MRILIPFLSLLLLAVPFFGSVRAFAAMNAYEALEIAKPDDSNPKNVADNDAKMKDAYRKAVKKYHPDGKSPYANAARFQEVQEAFPKIKTKALRDAYQVKVSANFQPPPSSGGNNDPNYFGTIIDSIYLSSQLVHANNPALGFFRTFFFPDGKRLTPELIVSLHTVGNQIRVSEETQAAYDSRFAIYSASIGFLFNDSVRLQWFASAFGHASSFSQGLVKYMITMTRAAEVRDADAFHTGQLDSFTLNLVDQNIVSDFLGILPHVCHGDMKGCLIELIDGIQAAPQVFRVIGLQSIQKIIALIDQVIVAQSIRWHFSGEAKRLHQFRAEMKARFESPQVRQRECVEILGAVLQTVMKPPYQ